MRSQLTQVTSHQFPALSERMARLCGTQQRPKAPADPVAANRPPQTTNRQLSFMLQGAEGLRISTGRDFLVKKREEYMFISCPDFEAKKIVESFLGLLSCKRNE